MTVFVETAAAAAAMTTRNCLMEKLRIMRRCQRMRLFWMLECEIVLSLFSFRLVLILMDSVLFLIGDDVHGLFHECQEDS